MSGAKPVASHAALAHVVYVRTGKNPSAARAVAGNICKMVGFNELAALIFGWNEDTEAAAKAISNCSVKGEL